MNTAIKSTLGAFLATGVLVSTANAEGVENAYGDFRLRLETVEQDNTAEDATALTLRSRIGYATDAYSGFSARVEVENNTALIDDYNDTNGNGGGFSVVPDPEFTELDQGFVQYKSDAVTVKLGRQVITYDNHRFVGHVGWRQDRQTYDGLSASWQVGDDLQLNAAYLEKRNLIFAEEKDVDSNDVLLNMAYKTGNGKLSAYAYLLEVDNNTENALDTFGVRYSGKTKLGKQPFSYVVEVATQTNEVGAASNDTDYLLFELAAPVGGVKAALGYEKLGSDGGAKGFATPLATLHKFNGWADQYLGTPNEGLVDVYASVSGKLAGGKWLVAYHDYSADEASAAVDDLGSEINALYARKFADGFSGGVKYAAFSAGDIKVDTDKLWVWVGYQF